jgi:3-oxoacyl-[acyl-carrier-protein] synthase II
VTYTSVYVTGMGALSCLGGSVEEFWTGLCRGECGIGPLTRFDAGGLPYTVAGEVRGFAPEPFTRCGFSAGAQFAAHAAAAALDGFPPTCLPALAVVLGSNFGPQELIARELGGDRSAGPDAPLLLASGPFGEDAGRVAERLGAGGQVVALSLSCASGNAAIAHVLELIRYGRAEAGLACGYDALEPLSWAGLSALRVMVAPREGQPAVVRPFDRDRAGTIFSEGAGCLLLESEEHARERGATLLAEVAGAGVNNNAYHLTHSDEEGSGLASAMLMALDDAGLEPDAVDYVNAHGTGTKLNDVAEARALGTVFGDRAGRIPVNSIKGSVGHAMGAAGALEAIACVMTLRTGRIPPTTGLEHQDPECNLDVVQGATRETVVTTALNNSAGIGGANAAVVFRRAEVRSDEGRA